jgi:hypothetical protein
MLPASRRCALTAINPVFLSELISLEGLREGRRSRFRADRINMGSMGRSSDDYSDGYSEMLEYRGSREERLRGKLGMRIRLTDLS